MSFISPLYVESISDVELTRVSRLLTHLEDKPGISIMADRGFTIKYILNDIGVILSVSSFLWMDTSNCYQRRQVRIGR